jgi:hypothetical protein
LHQGPAEKYLFLFIKSFLMQMCVFDLIIICRSA